jgi:hypothetical protein
VIVGSLAGVGRPDLRGGTGHTPSIPLRTLLGLRETSIEGRRLKRLKCAKSGIHRHIAIGKTRPEHTKLASGSRGESGNFDDRSKI